jgi:hypothetical protein
MPASNSVPMNTLSLYPVPEWDRFYAVYVRTDPAREPLAASESIPEALATAANKTGRPRSDFEVQEISKERFEKLKRFLDP